MINNNDDYKNISWCRIQMKICQKRYNFSGKLFIASNVFAELLDIILIFLHPEPLWYFVDFLVRAAGIGTGLLNFLKHNSKYGCISILAYLIAMEVNYSQPEYFSEMFSKFFGFGFYIMFSVLSIVSAVFVMLLNQKYRKLEQAEGFPYFSERFENQKENMQKFSDNNYQTSVQEDFQEKCNNNSKMDKI